MAYEPHTWVTDELITHDKLNHMETGIANAGSGGADLSEYAKLNKPHFQYGIICDGFATDEDCGNNSIIVGGSCSATGDRAASFGAFNASSGDQSFSEGQSTQSNGTATHAEGMSTIASAEAAHAEGRSTEASGKESHAEGSGTVASGNFSHSGGIKSVASLYASFSHGNNVLASAQAQFVVGSMNVENTDSSSAFIVGNGKKQIVDGTENITRSNCFRATDTGTYASGAYNSSGADYAELFEWADSNPTNEDRRGLFVTLDGERIRIAKPGDKNIIGIVSGNPTVLGDVYDDQWQGMYMTDVFGSPIWENVELPDQTEERPDPEHPGKTITEVVIPAHTEHRQKLNPNYDNTQGYKARTERPEWAPVGLIGKLVAVDDGTCEPDGYCTVGYDDGVATSSSDETRYYVMSRIDNTHICVFIKAH